MQINVELLLRKKCFNYDWRRAILSFLKYLIKNENPELYQEYYGAGKTKIKNYTYWAFLPGAVFEKDYISLTEDKIKVSLSSSDTKFLMSLYNGMIRFKGQTYPLAKDNEMEIQSVKIKKVKEIEEEEIIINMLSPLVARCHYKDKPDRYYLFNEDGFDESIQQNMKTRFENKTELPTLEPIKCKKVIVKAFDAVIPASMGVFRLKGDVSQLNRLYLNGVGNKTGGGFGKFEIIG